MQQEEADRPTVQRVLDGAFHPFAILSPIYDDQGHLVDFRYDYVNEAAILAHRVSREWLLGKQLREVVPEPRLFYACRRVMTTGKPWRAQAYSYPGAASPAHIAAGYFDLSISKVDGAIAVAWQDVSRQVRIAEDLQEREEWQRLIVESVHEYAIFALDPEGRIISWNPGAQRILGHEEAEVLGQHMRLIFTPEDQAAGIPERELQVAAARGQSLDERWHVRKDGSRFWASGILTRLRRPNGELRGFAKIMRDNTAQRQAEETQARLLRQLEQERARLDELTQTLETRVRERTEQVRMLASELTIVELRERQRIAQVLHDNLQQLLYALDMRINLLQSHINPAHRDMLDQFQELVQEAITATRTLTVELSPPVLHGEGLVESLQWLANQMGITHHLQVTVTAHGPVRIEQPELRGLLFQIVRELLFNVVKHAVTGQAWVTLRQGQTALQIAVEDRGQGFVVEEMPEIRGGFGLSSIRHRLDLFGGQIEIHSTPGAGTRVLITVPRSALHGQS